MPARAAIPLAALCLTVLLSIPPAPPPTLAEPGSLQVVANLPQGETGIDAAVQVRFDRPVVAVGAPDPSNEDGRRLLKVSPERDGYYHWVGSKTLTYVFRGPLPYGTRFQATVPRGVQAMDGARLDGDVSWDFFTPGPLVLRSYPHPGDNQVRPDEHFLFAFDQPVSPDTVAAHVHMEGIASFAGDRPDSAFLTLLSSEIRNHPIEHIVRLLASPAPAWDREYMLVLDGGVTGLGGPVPMGESFEIPFSTVGPLRFMGLDRRLSFSNPVHPESLRAYLSVENAPQDWELGLHGEPRKDFWLWSHLTQDSDVVVRIRQGLPDVYGQRLAEPVEATTESPKIEPYLRLTDTAPFRTLQSSREVGVRFWGLDSVCVRAAPVGAWSFHDLVADSIMTWPLQKTFVQSPYGATKATVDLSPLLSPEGIGRVILEAFPWDVPLPDRQKWPHDSREWISWSDIGTVTKTWKDGGLGWVVRLSSGAPVAGGKFERMNKDRKVVGHSTTDLQGLSTLPSSPEGTDRRRDQTTLVLTTEHGGEAVHESRNAGGDARKDLPRHRSWPEEASSVFMFSDRPLYRPGETIHLAGILRRLNVHGVSYSEIDSILLRYGAGSGAMEVDTLLAVDSEGWFAFDLPTDPHMIGRYTFGALADTAERSHYLGHHDAEVAAYRAPSFETLVASDDTLLFPGDTLTASIKASYFFGAPLAGAQYRWWISDRRRAFRSEAFPDFRFDAPSDDRRDRGRPSGTGVLDEDGTALQRVAMDTLPEPSEILLEVTTRTETRDGVSDRILIPYFPSRILAGVKLSKRFTPAGEPVVLDLMALDPARDIPVSGRPIHVEAYGRDWKKTLVEFAKGRFRTQVDWVDTLTASWDLASSDQPLELKWAPPETGVYRILVRTTDSSGQSSRAAVTCRVHGNKQDKRRAAHDEKLLLSSDKDLYRFGDVAEVHLDTPVRSNWALVTVEKNQVLEAMVVDLTSHPGVFSIPIGKEHWPNCYVGVHVIEPEIPKAEAPDLSDEERNPLLRMGYVELPVDVSGQRLDVLVSTDQETYAPGDTVTLHLEARGASPHDVRFSVAVVDDAVLALTRKEVLDPFQYFYESRGLGVATGSRIGALNRESLESSTAMALSSGVVDPFSYHETLRRDFVTTAYWNPAVTSDEKGHAEVRFALPDNLTRFSVVAVAASENAFGRGQGVFEVSLPLVLEPAVPRFLRSGDTLQVAVELINGTGNAIEGKVSAESSMGLMAPGVQNIALLSMARKVWSLPAICGQEDSVYIEFSGTLGGLHDAVRVSLPVQPATYPAVAALAGMTRGTGIETLMLPSRTVPGSADLEVVLASGALAGAERAFSYVIDYPHGCIEQTASRLLALLLYREIVKDPVTLATMDRKIRESILLLQEDVGESARFWPRGDYGYRAGTYFDAYALYALLRARDWPEVSRSRLESGLHKLEMDYRVFQRPRPGRDQEPSPNGFVWFVLSEAVQAGLDFRMRAADWTPLAAEMMAWSEEDRFFGALALKNLGSSADTALQVWTNARGRLELSARDAVLTSLEEHTLAAPFKTPARATALALLLGSRMAPKDPVVPLLALGLLNMRTNGHWRMTHDDVLSLLALSDYQRLCEPAGEQTTVATVVLDEHVHLAEVPVSASDPYRAPIPMDEVSPGSEARMRFSVQDGNPLYYTGVLKWSESALDAAPKEGGFTLTRTLEPFNNAGPLGPGDVVRVKFRVVVEQAASYLALRDPLPATLEAVQGEFQTESSSLSNPHLQFDYPRLPAVHREIHDTEVRFYTGDVEPGIYEIEYLARIRSAGSFLHPPATIEAMYEPEFHASTAAGRFVVAGD